MKSSSVRSLIQAPGKNLGLESHPKANTYQLLTKFRNGLQRIPSFLGRVGAPSADSNP